MPHHAGRWEKRESLLDLSSGHAAFRVSASLKQLIRDSFLPPNEARRKSAVALTPGLSRNELLVGSGAASLSGVMWFLACPNFNLWPLAWAAMVPVLFVMERASSTRRAMFFAWWASVVGNAGGFYWVVALLERFAHLPWIGAALLYLLLCSYQALRLLLFGWAVRVIRRSTNLPLALVAPVAMVTVEICVPFIFPYYLAITQASQLHVIQIAELTGPLGVTALLVMINGALCDLLTQRRRRLPAALVSLTLMLAVLGYGHLRINQMRKRRDDAPKIKVGIVQPNVAFDQKGLGQMRPGRNYLIDLQLRSAELEANGADLIIWPETIFPTYVSRQAAGDWGHQHPLRIKRGFTAPLILGALTYDLTRGDRHLYNSALLLDREGKFTGKYDKNYLVIFGEYVPGVERFSWMRKLLPASAEQYAPGKEILPFAFQTTDGQSWRFGPMICFEDILPEFGRKLAQHHPHLMINLTDDSWFGESSEPWQHLALSVFRSVELRTELVRAVNTGVSSYVDATGYVYSKTYSLDPVKDTRGADKILAEVALLEGGHTLYAVVGDLFGYLCVATTIFLLFVHPRLRRRAYARALG